MLLPPECNLVLEGSNVVVHTGGGYGISTAGQKGTLTISGSGSLDVTAGLNGIWAYYLHIKDGTIRAASTGSGAIAAYTVTISGGTVFAQGQSWGLVGLSGIEKGRVIISGGVVTATGIGANGISSAGPATISGGTVTATGGLTAIWSTEGFNLTGMTIKEPVGGAVGDSVNDPGGKAILLNGKDALKVILAPTPASGGSSSSSTTTETVKNSDGSTTVTTITTQPDGTKETVATTTNTDDTKVVVTSTEKKQSDGSTVKTETVVKTDGKGNTAASGTVTTDSATGTVTIPARVIETLAKTEGSTLTVETPNATLVLDNAALKALVSADGKPSALTITPVPFEKLPQQAQKNLEGAAVFSFSINGGGVDFGSGTVTVTLDYTRKAANAVVVVYYVDNNGNMTRMPGTSYQNGKATYKTNHFSLYAVTEEAMPFADVSVDAYYADAVLWAVDKGVTSGTSATTFNPGGICTRAQTVTFLWRAMGSPEPTSTVNPFTDVKADAYYYKAVLWAVEKGVTGGTSATTFNPDAVCSRSQVVTLMWRAEGSPVVNFAMNFIDIPADGYYTEAVRWAVSEGITGGTSATAFSPSDACTRAQIVTFLLRQFGK